MEEVWKDISGFEGLYQVSNWGRVKSMERTIMRSNGRIIPIKERILKLFSNNYGYLIFKKRTIHHLVWDAFGDKPRNGHLLQVDHIDNNKLNNHIYNLQLLPNRENCIKRSLQKQKSSIYTGVCWDKNTNKWKAYIRINKKHKHLGRFTSELEASQSYQKALLLLKIEV